MPPAGSQKKEREAETDDVSSPIAGTVRDALLHGDIESPSKPEAEPLSQSAPLPRDLRQVATLTTLPYGTTHNFDNAVPQTIIPSAAST
jgi:hypothetical protein